MRDHKIKISAESLEEFKKIDEFLQTLPESIYNQIETAKNGGLIGKVEATLRLIPGQKDMNFTLPSNTSQIRDFDSFIGIYADDIFLRIEDSSFQKVKDLKINFIFDRG